MPLDMRGLEISTRKFISCIGYKFISSIGYTTIKSIEVAY